MTAVFAAEQSTIVTALTNAMTSAVNDAMEAIGAILPIVLPVLGAVTVIGIGIKIFKKVTGKA